MTIATKTLATIMLVTMLAMSSVSVPTVSAKQGVQKHETKQLQRLYRRHDRSYELRASVLGLTPDELRERVKAQSFEKVLKQSGFRDIASFHAALVGKAKDELRKRGWNDEKISKFVNKKLDKYSKKAAQA